MLQEVTQRSINPETSIIVSVGDGLQRFQKRKLGKIDSKTRSATILTYPKTHMTDVKLFSEPLDFLLSASLLTESIPLSLFNELTLLSLFSELTRCMLLFEDGGLIDREAISFVLAHGS